MKDEVNAAMARRLTLAALLACAVLALAAAGAQALIVTVGKTQVSIDPLSPGARRRRREAERALERQTAGEKQPGTQTGGTVMTSNTNITIFWDPAGGSSFPAGYQAGINRYFEDVAARQRRAAEHRLDPDAVRRQLRIASSAAPTSTRPPTRPTAAPPRRNASRGAAGDSADELRAVALAADRPQPRLLPAHARRRRKLHRTGGARMLRRRPAPQLLRLPPLRLPWRRQIPGLRQQPVRERPSSAATKKTSRTATRRTKRSRPGSPTSTPRPSPTRC